MKNRTQIDLYQVQMRSYLQASSSIETLRKFLEEKGVLTQSSLPDKKEKINKLLLIA